MTRPGRIVAVASSACMALNLAGCTTFGSHVRGSFACSAPDGTCAPSTMIDDAALAEIAREDRAGDMLIPAGPYETDDGDGRRSSAAARARHVQASGSSSTAGLAGSGKVLRVIFPAHVDRFGRLHERKVVQAMVDRESPAVLALAGQNAQQSALLSAAEAAPALSSFAIEALPVGDAPGVLSVTPGSPIDAIKADVAARVGKPARGATAFPGDR